MKGKHATSMQWQRGCEGLTRIEHAEYLALDLEPYECRSSKKCAGAAPAAPPPGCDTAGGEMRTATCASETTWYAAAPQPCEKPCDKPCDKPVAARAAPVAARVASSPAPPPAATGRRSLGGGGGGPKRSCRVVRQSCCPCPCPWCWSCPCPWPMSCGSRSPLGGSGAPHGDAAGFRFRCLKRCRATAGATGITGPPPVSPPSPSLLTAACNPAALP